MLILQLALFLAVLTNFGKLITSPSLRSQKDSTTWAALVLFMCVSVLGIWNSSALIQGNFRNCFVNFQLRYMMQSILLFAAGAILITSYTNVCL